MIKQVILQSSKIIFSLIISVVVAFGALQLVKDTAFSFYLILIAPPTASVLMNGVVLHLLKARKYKLTVVITSVCLIAFWVVLLLIAFTLLEGVFYILEPIFDQSQG